MRKTLLATLSLLMLWWSAAAQGVRQPAELSPGEPQKVERTEGTTRSEREALIKAIAVKLRGGASQATSGNAASAKLMSGLMRSPELSMDDLRSLSRAGSVEEMLQNPRFNTLYTNAGAAGFKPIDGGQQEFPAVYTTVPSNRTCGFEEAMGLNTPEGRRRMQEYDEWLNRKVAEKKQRIAAGIERDQNTIYRIPVIVHVIHNGEPVGQGANISAAQVLSQIQVLNEDFRRTNPDRTSTPAIFQAVAADARIEFVPATVDPLGVTLAEPGIRRFRGTRTAYSPDQFNTEVKPVTSWDPTRYANLWTAGLSSNLLGYAQFPPGTTLPGMPANPGAPVTDGVVVGFNFFGSIRIVNTPQLAAGAPFNLGRTLTHEIGHWIGLRHIWGDGNCSVDDFCADTPNAGAPNFTGTPCTFPGPNSCTEPWPPTGADAPDMFQNYMDYSDDPCMNLFTNDQVLRMRTALEQSPIRGPLLTSPVAGPRIIANFSQDKLIICPGQTVRYTNTSVGVSGATVGARNWTFQGGTPATAANVDVVDVTYAAVGTFETKLLIQSTTGALRDSITKTIQVIDYGSTASPANLTQDFVATAFPPTVPANWESVGSGNTAWRRSGVGNGNAGSMVADNYNVNMTGAQVLLKTPVLNFAALPAGLSISFHVAHAIFPGAIDSLEVYYEDVCTGAKTTLFKKGGEGLATVPGTRTAAFVPANASEWDTIVVRVPRFVGVSFGRVVFRNVGAFGNNIFVDNIQITPSAGVVADFEANFPTNCVGFPIRFFDRSTRFGADTTVTYAWSFPGGTPATSTVKNPVVTYSVPGRYNVTLTITRPGDAATSTLTRNAYINMSSFTGVNTTLAESFESPDPAAPAPPVFPAPDWTTRGALTGTGWVQSSGISGYGNGRFSASIPNAVQGFFGVTPNAAVFRRQTWLQSPIVDIRPYTQNLEIKFDYAYSLRGTAADSLRLVYTTDCGQNWRVLFQKGGAELATTNVGTALLTSPGANAWQTATAYVPNAGNFDYIQFGFINIGGGGNVIYLDNIQIREVGAAVADFRINPTSVCTNLPIQFTDLSTAITSNITGWSWSFPGAVVTTSTDRNPVVTYANPGNYTVSLTITLANSQTVTVTKQNYVRASAYPGTTTTLVEGFESGLQFQNWTVQDIGWSTGATGYRSNTAAVANNFDVDYTGQKSYLVSPVVNVVNTDYLEVAFDVAYAPWTFFGSVFADSLAIGWSTDCGRTFQVVRRFGWREISATGLPTGNAFFPSGDSDWRRIKVYIPTGTAQAGQVAIINIGQFGNNLFIDNINITPKPAIVADFTVGEQVCSNFAVQFRDASRALDLGQTINQWNWTFEGGTPATSTLRNPLVTYANPGVYDVKLVIRSASSVDSLVMIDRVTVVPFTAAGPVSEGFEDRAAFANAGWKIDLPNTWGIPPTGTITSSAGAGGSSSAIAIDNYNTDYTGVTTDLYSPFASLQGRKNLSIQFDYAYAPYLEGTTVFSDNFQVQISTDCGATFTTVWPAAGFDLATAAARGALFVPTANDWRPVSIDLDFFNEAGNRNTVQVRFRNVGAFGNVFWLDNIRIEGFEFTAPQASFDQLTTLDCTPNTLLIGQNVTFRDQSLNKARTWSWSMEGATPAFSNERSPTVSYRYPGTYPVSLTVSNPAGTNTITRTMLVTVLPEVRRANFPDGSLLTFFTLGGQPISGHNTAQRKASADLFYPNQIPAGGQLDGVEIMLSRATVNAGSPNGVVTVKVWASDGPSIVWVPGATPVRVSAPRTVLAQKDVRIADLRTAFLANCPAYVKFDNPISPTDSFYVGVEYYYTAPNLGLITVSTTDLFTLTTVQRGRAFEQASNDVWSSFTNNYVAGGTPVRMSHAFMPRYVLDKVTGIEENEISRALTVFPNPSADKFNIAAEGLEVKGYVLYNMLGQPALTSDANASPQVVDVSKVPSGLYMLEIHTDKGKGLKRVSVLK